MVVRGAIPRSPRVNNQRRAEVNPEDIAKMMDAVAAYGELLGGMKKKFIAEGFADDTAEALVLEILRKMS